MAQRISDKDLERLADRLNVVTKSPQTPWVRDETTGRNKAQVGNFHISHANGGVCLHRMHNESGGVSTPLTSYHEPKRALYDKMRAFLDGLEYAQVTK